MKAQRSRATANAIRDATAFAPEADEPPTFVLRANDPLAPWILLHYSTMVEDGGGDATQIRAARKIADDMFTWQTLHPSEVDAPAK
jgi:hypothetical protein